MQVNILDFMFLLNFAILVQFFKVYLYLRNLSLSKFSWVYAYFGAYAYCFWNNCLGSMLIWGSTLTRNSRVEVKKQLAIASINLKKCGHLFNINFGETVEVFSKIG